ncbi:MAG: hypothetical protein KatS3mg068_2352 [Candidatus Sericytochromatia bacterium]|nr:MAG: hypothetical protein KatS3mg068_2352 [Candidatus Sericytochromatia bacterium]
MLVLFEKNFTFIKNFVLERELCNKATIKYHQKDNSSQLIMFLRSKMSKKFEQENKIGLTKVV